MGEDRREPPSGRSVTVDEATRHLGLTVDAVRKRVQRWQIAHEKYRAGRVWIILYCPDTASTVQDESPENTGQADALIAAKDETIEELRDRVRRFEREVDTRNEEIRRRDQLLVAALERIPAIEAPQEATEATETVSEEPESAALVGVLEIRGGMQDEKNLREDAKQLLRVAYERQVAGGGRVTQVDLAAGAEERGLSPTSPRLGVLVEYMEVMGWVEVDLFARGTVSATARRITGRGMEVVREASVTRPED
jgi:hypothetical protein